MTKSLTPEQESAAEKLREAAKSWRAAKKAERKARDRFAHVVCEVVASGVLSENKVSGVTDTPRMTIRKMLGKAKV